MALLTDGTLTTADPHYYNAALDTTGGHLEVTAGQCRFLDIYCSAKTFWRYGPTPPTAPQQAVIPAGALVTIPMDPEIAPGTAWQVFLKAATGTLETSATAHNNAYFSAG